MHSSNSYALSRLKKKIVPLLEVQIEAEERMTTIWKRVPKYHNMAIEETKTLYSMIQYPQPEQLN